MEITLQIGGRERTFSERELIEILEKHFANQKETHFEVNPKAINQELFSEPREDSEQEATRQIILRAFIKLNEEQERYGRPFKTMIPEKTWSSIKVEELEKIASNLGDHMADWVEQALEWAQRIANGETWEDVCNEPDTADWYRVVFWGNNDARFVGGARKNLSSDPASSVHDYGYKCNNILMIAVPLVVLY